MEHSALHAIELIGQVIALGGVFFMLGLLRPAERALGAEAGSGEMARVFAVNTTKWVCRGALVAALATALNIFEDVAEARGKTIFSTVDLPLTWLFATGTHVGLLSLARIGTLILMAGLARLPGNFKWWLTGLAGFGAMIFTSLVSHAAAQPVGRVPMEIAQVAHITTAAIWVGVLVQLLAARSSIEGPAGTGGIPLIAQIVRRFSPVALGVTSLLGLSGLLMVFRLLGDIGAVPTSAYGLTFIVKLVMLTPAIYAGAVNFRVIRPKLLSLADKIKMSTPADVEDSGALRRRFGKMLELEVTAGIMVIVVAGIFASVSPPGEEGAYRATSSQMQAMLSPRLPAMNIVNPATFYGADTRGLDDLQYAEFTHHWSGVMVGLLGLGWLLQSFGGRLAKWAGYCWPLLMVPFAGFVAVASDPEVWLLHKVSFHQVISDPQLLEHQLGAAMILLIMWLGWRDLRQPEGRRPLGYAMPVILIAGGVLLLGHAHSTFTITEGVTNLINLQHAVFGAFILFGGMTRWLSLRDLIPRRTANFIWPCMIVGLGVFMAFFYREVE